MREARTSGVRYMAKSLQNIWVTSDQTCRWLQQADKKMGNEGGNKNQITVFYPNAICIKIEKDEPITHADVENQDMIEISGLDKHRKHFCCIEIPHYPTWRKDNR